MAYIYAAKFERCDFGFEPALEETVEVPCFRDDEAEAWRNLHALDRPFENKSSWIFQGFRKVEKAEEEL